MAPFRTTEKIVSKLREKHKIEIEEVREAFLNYDGEFLKETRSEHQGENQKLWFISETDHDRILKIVFIEDQDQLDLITAYDPDEEDITYYEKLTQIKR
jgi:uncharacterized DUF497 family protein